MSEALKPYLQTVYWKDIRDKIFATNPDFALLVDELSPGKDYPLYLAKYRYGDVIVDEGICRIPLPETGELVLASDSRLPADVRSGLGYCAPRFPPGVVLKNSIQLCLTPKINYVSWLKYPQGVIFALWKYLTPEANFHPVKIFNITAGVRSIFMVPNIGDAKFHKNLRLKHNLPNLPLPKSLNEHWPIFTALTNSKMSQCNWYTELLFFSEKWAQKFNSSDENWVRLCNFLLKLVAKGTDFWRNKMLFDHAFSCAQANKNLKPNPYIADTAKHLIMLCLGVLEAFAPALNDNDAPVSLLQKIYLEDYGLKDYVPTIMLPSQFSTKIPGKQAYYSLIYPTTLEFSPKSRKFVNNLYDLRELKHVANRIFEEIIEDKLGLDGTPVKDVMEKTRFDYFHSKKDRYGEIRLTNEMSIEDPDLIKSLAATKNKEFAQNGAFVRSCVRLLSVK
ncbi:MAG: hypothetical protein M1561_04710 [Gammaproteobacteria bacterium]|nr:hypothetical protein [Gammaproteobacteria bacterium]